MLELHLPLDIIIKTNRRIPEIWSSYKIGLQYLFSTEISVPENWNYQLEYYLSQISHFIWQHVESKTNNITSQHNMCGLAKVLCWLPWGYAHHITPTSVQSCLRCSTSGPGSHDSLNWWPHITFTDWLTLSSIIIISCVVSSVFTE